MSAPPPPPPGAPWQPPPLSTTPTVRAGTSPSPGMNGGSGWPPPPPFAFAPPTSAPSFLANGALVGNGAAVPFANGAHHSNGGGFFVPAAPAEQRTGAPPPPAPAWWADAEVDAPTLSAEEDSPSPSPIPQLTRRAEETEEEDEEEEEEEDEEARAAHRRNTSTTYATTTTTLPRLVLHPLATGLTAVAPGGGATAGMVDPVTAALARQQQQLHRGEPRSPLSPQTLAALCGASAEGRHRHFLAQLTPEDVLAPPPLALTWYPTVPPGVTLHPERKRGPEEGVAGTMARHEVDQLSEEEEARGGGGGDRSANVSYTTDVPLPPRQRLRADPLAALPRSDNTTEAAAAAAGAWSEGHGGLSASVDAQGLPQAGEAFVAASVEGGEGSRGEARVGEMAEVAEQEPEEEEGEEEEERPLPSRFDAHRKRKRGERVYEFPSHGRRLN